MYNCSGAEMWGKDMRYVCWHWCDEYDNRVRMKGNGSLFAMNGRADPRFPRRSQGGDFKPGAWVHRSATCAIVFLGPASGHGLTKRGSDR